MMPIIRDLMALAFPESCVVCAGPVSESEQSFCLECRLNLPVILSEPFSSHEPLLRKFSGLIPVHHAITYLQFQKGGATQRLLHALKYRNQPEIGEVLGRLLAAELSRRGMGQAFDLVLPVPLHARKERLRGYNQAMMLATGLAQGFACEAASHYLIRTRATETQTRKRKTERILNVKQVFALTEAGERTLPGRRILLVDDVVTTGSTLEACARVLETANPAGISVAALAMA
jgi:ComF family protein